MQERLLQKWALCILMECILILLNLYGCETSDSIGLFVGNVGVLSL